MSGDLIGLRWPDGFWCPACGEAKAWPVRVRPTLFHCAACGRQTSVTAGTILPDTRTPLTTWFRAMWWVTSQRTGASAKDLQQVLGLGSYETAWTWLHKLRRAQVEVDETYLGGLEEGVRGRQTEKKALIAVAVEEAGLSYDRLEKHGYRHRITLLKGRKESAAELLPRVHRVVSLLKRWLLGTHQGAVSPAHLEYDLDEFTFRFNRRTSRHCGKLFHRLVSRPSRSIRRPTRHWSSTCGLDAQGGVGDTTTNSRHLSQGDTPMALS